MESRNKNQTPLIKVIGYCMQMFMIIMCLIGSIITFGLSLMVSRVFPGKELFFLFSVAISSLLSIIMFSHAFMELDKKLRL